MKAQTSKKRETLPGRPGAARPKKAVPAFKGEAEEREFWETHESTEYVDWSRAEPVRLPNLKPSTQTISLRLPLGLLERIKIEANRRDMLYQSLIKAWLSDQLRRP